jgi:uncharacterized metal-binding protein YceD (DUF177 family)
MCLSIIIALEMERSDMYKLRISEILTTVGEKKTFSVDVPITYADELCAIVSPIHADLTITNLDSLVLVTGDAQATVSVVCNRCANSFPIQVTGEVEEEFRSEDQLFQFNAADREIGRDDLQFTIDAKGNIDIEETLREVILSNLPLNPVCPACPEPITYTVK